jgi:hypothetical protein
LADLQDPPHKWHGFRIFAHNPEVIGSNPIPATEKEPEYYVLWFFVKPAYYGWKFLIIGGFSNEPEYAKLVKKPIFQHYLQIHRRFPEDQDG